MDFSSILFKECIIVLNKIDLYLRGYSFYFNLHFVCSLIQGYFKQIISIRPTVMDFNSDIFEGELF